MEYEIRATPDGDVVIRITDSKPQILIRMSAVQADQMSRVLGTVSGHAILNLAMHRIRNRNRSIHESDQA
jgi:hypothetical protein